MMGMVDVPDGPVEMDPLDWVMVYREGKKHVNAYALSRLPVDSDVVESENDEHFVEDSLVDVGMSNVFSPDESLKMSDSIMHIKNHWFLLLKL